MVELIPIDIGIPGALVRDWRTGIDVAFANPSG